MAATSTTSLPLYEVKYRRNTIPKAVELVILLLLLILIDYRIFTLRDNGIPWLLALLCESWFTFNWILNISTKWNQMITKSYPERLLKREIELPSLDMFVTTADPILEPPLITINTVLSLLAVDYPANKLACYVSDDAASPLTFYSLVEAAKYAKIWIPFCKKYNIWLRAPFRYFKEEVVPCKDSSSDEFLEDFQIVKEGYAKLCMRIEEASKDMNESPVLTGEYEVFSNIQLKNHSSIVKVIWENKDEGLPEGQVPHLIYVSREKRPKHPHHFKAGAMNVLTRVSGVMTNAPFLLNMDCDMYVNNPQVVLQAMCFLLGSENETLSGFVQFPQLFYDGFKDDPFGNQLVCFQEFIGRGMAGIQGPVYQGTGCFHRRKIIYGLLPNNKIAPGDQSNNGDLQRVYGKSTELIESAGKIISNSKITMETSKPLSNSIDSACQVAGCGYEYNTRWGKEVGWLYGSATEDALLGLTIHSRGWRSVLCHPDPPGFLGCTPSSGPIVFIQMKRWCTGLSEVFLSSKNPLILTLTAQLKFRQCLGFLWFMTWPLRSVSETCYAVLPAYCIISNSHSFPKGNEPVLLIPIITYILYNLYTLSEFLRTGQSVRAWWNHQRMWKIYPATAWLFGLLSVLLKFFGLSETTFEVTRKDTEDDTDGSNGKLTFDESPVFVTGTLVLMVNLAALGIGLFTLKQTTIGEHIGEIICSQLVVLYFWPFLKGLFSRGKFGIPLSTIIKAGGFTLLFVQFSSKGF